jgi:hypothetical protein
MRRLRDLARLIGKNKTQLRGVQVLRNRTQSSPEGEGLSRDDEKGVEDQYW